MDEFNWITRSCASCSRYNKGIDVSIKTVKGKPNDRLSFRFGNNSFYKISKTQFIKMCVVGNKLYFAESNDLEGFKLSTLNKDNSVGYVRLKNGIINFELGDYKLFYDDKNKLYYVNKESKLKENK